MGKVKSCSLCITPIGVKHPRAEVTKPAAQQVQSFSNPLFPSPPPCSSRHPKSEQP